MLRRDSVSKVVLAIKVNFFGSLLPSSLCSGMTG
jgi:hypothetical protein